MIASVEEVDVILGYFYLYVLEKYKKNIYRGNQKNLPHPPHERRTTEELQKNKCSVKNRETTIAPADFVSDELARE